MTDILDWAKSAAKKLGKYGVFSYFPEHVDDVARALVAAHARGHAEGVAQGEMAMDILSGLALTLGVGSGDETTTPEQFRERIAWGFDYYNERSKTLGAAQERKRCERIADDEAKSAEKLALQHPENTVERDRCWAKARMASKISAAIRKGEQ